MSHRSGPWSPPIPQTPLGLAERFGQRSGLGSVRVPYPAHWTASRLGPLAALVQALEQHLGRSLVLLDAYRSPQYHEALGDLAEELPHTEGLAVDVAAPPLSPDEIVQAAVRLQRRGAHHIGTIIRYPQFVHLDQRQGALRLLLVGARRARPLPSAQRETVCLGCHRPISLCLCVREAPEPPLGL